MDSLHLEASHLNNTGKSFTNLEKYELANTYFLDALAIVKEPDFFEKLPEDYDEEDIQLASLYQYTILANLANNEIQRENFEAAEAVSRPGLSVL